MFKFSNSLVISRSMNFLFLGLFLVSHWDDPVIFDWKNEFFKLTKT